MHIERTLRSVFETATMAISEAVQAAQDAMDASILAAQDVMDAMADEFSGAEPECREVTATLDACELSALRVSNRSGSVLVMGHDATEVSVKARVSTRSSAVDAVMERVRDTVRREGSVIEIDGLSEPRTHVDYEIAVPRHLQVAVSVGSGIVTVLDVTGPVDVSSANGEVGVQNTGDVSVQTANGAVNARDLAGSSTLRTKNGAVTVTRARGALEAHSANGAISVEDAHASLTIRTVNGRVKYRGEVRGDFDITSTNGSITLRVPADSVFELDADVGVGQVHIDLPCSEGSVAARDANETLPAVNLRSMVGRIAIEAL
jgi:hypothetical protein